VLAFYTAIVQQTAIFDDRIASLAGYERKMNVNHNCLPWFAEASKRSRQVP